MDLNKPSKKDLESFMIWWNVRFRYDRLWRRKYNIPFMSEEHLNAHPIDIYLDILEDKMVAKARASFIEKQQDVAEYKKDGKFLKEEKVSQEDEDALFRKIKLK